MKYRSGDPPLGVAYLAAVLRNIKDVAVEIVDTTFMDNPREEIGSILKGSGYDFVGISIMTLQLDDSLGVIKAAKQFLPQAKIVVGGPHATVMPEETLAAAPEIDILVTGEGEEILPRIIAGEELEKIPNLYYRTHGEIKKTERIIPTSELDALPFPALDMLPMEKYIGSWFQVEPYRGTSIITSRGCPYVCTFCQPTLRYIFGDKIRQRTPQNVIDELKQLKQKFGIEAFMFQDDTFNFNRPWIEEFCRLMIEQKVELLWGCNVRANLTKEDQLVMMKKAGLRKINIGLESASQRILDDIYDKKITVAQARAAAAAAKKVGLLVQGYFIIGAPTETEAEIKETIKYAVNLDIDMATFSICTPLPKTYLYDRTKDLIVSDAKVDYYRNSIYKQGVALDQKLLDKYRRRALLLFYLNPKRLRLTLRFIFSLGGIKRLFLKLKRF